MPESKESSSSKDEAETKAQASASESQATPSTVSPSASTPPSTTTKKVKVHFVPVGSAPIMKKNKFQLSSDQRFASVQLFLRKMLKLKAGDSLWLYCNSAFLPSPNEFVGDLNDCFAVRGELQIQYSLQEAWG